MDLTFCYTAKDFFGRFAEREDTLQAAEKKEALKAFNAFKKNKDSALKTGALSFSFDSSNEFENGICTVVKSEKINSVDIQKMSVENAKKILMVLFD